MSRNNDAWMAFALTKESDLPPPMPNRRKFQLMLSRDRQLEKAISKQELKDSFASTILKIRFAKESFHQLGQIDLKLSAKLFHKKEIPEIKLRINMENYFKLLRELDSFMFELYGSLDYFSREINLVLGLGLKDPHCSFGEVTKMLGRRKVEDDLRRVTLQMCDSEWFQYVRKLRHRLTHRSGIIVFFSNRELYFPDDPLSEPESADKRMKIVATCQLWLERAMGYIEEATCYLGESLFLDWHNPEPC